MCPACVASAAWVVGGVVSTGGVSALAAKILGNKKKLSQDDLTKRSKQYVDNYERDDRDPGKSRAYR
jgi:hypothetical protein